MSAVTQAGRGSTDDPSTELVVSGRPRPRSRHRAALIVMVVVFGWSTIELVDLVLNHTTGPELYGVLVAGLSVGAAVLGLLLLSTNDPRLRYVLPLVALWVGVAFGGIAGAVAHIVGPVAGHGPVDLAPRPVAAPLIFTLFGLVGCAALWFGRRTGAARSRTAGKE